MDLWEDKNRKLQAAEAVHVMEQTCLAFQKTRLAAQNIHLRCDFILEKSKIYVQL